MFDCNLIKSKLQKLQEAELPNLYPSAIAQAPMAHQLPRIPVAPLPTPAPAPFTPDLPGDQPAAPFPPTLPGPFPSSPPITIPANPLSPSTGPTPIDYESLQYLNGYLRTQIGRYVEVDFLIGSTNRAIRPGILVGVGINYILLQDATTHDITACDFYNIKFFKSYAVDYPG